MADLALSPIAAHYFQVHELIAYIRGLLEADPTLSDVWVAGEITELTQSAAGHVYFTVQDDAGRIGAVMFRSAARRQTFPLRVGFEALVHGAVGIYEQRSTYQLIADVVLPGESGLLRAQFEVLRQRLEAEGLFAEGRKRPLPKIPRRIGIVTSEAGAVIHDMLNVWRRRFPALEIVVAAAAVQGEDAPRQIVRALQRLNDFHEVQDPLDVIILARGGGPPEELAVFNDEGVARAIFAALVPVVSAVGHEVDYTIADLVADVRAPTPSAAAEIVVPDLSEINRGIVHLKDQLRFALVQRVGAARVRAEGIRQRLDRHSPSRLITERRRAVDDLVGRGYRTASAIITVARTRVEAGGLQLAALDPTTTLRRGYAICIVGKGTVVVDSEQLTRGDRFELRLGRGEVAGEVVETRVGPSGANEEKAHAG
ncbi:MAG: exodeoxyribonuclease large subunit [Chloroflexi bacterium]|nr:exodeoxyribonuclease large subunit [Chloroflexota bacterium]